MARLLLATLVAMFISTLPVMSQTSRQVEACVMQAFTEVVRSPEQIGNYIDLDNLSRQMSCDGRRPSGENIRQFVAERAGTSLPRYPSARVEDVTVTHLSGSQFSVTGYLRGVHFLANGARVVAIISMSGRSCRLISATAYRVFEVTLVEYLEPRVCEQG